MTALSYFILMLSALALFDNNKSNKAEEPLFEIAVPNVFSPELNSLPKIELDEETKLTLGIKGENSPLPASQRGSSPPAPAEKTPQPNTVPPVADPPASTPSPSATVERHGVRTIAWAAAGVLGTMVLVWLLRKKR